MKKNKKKKVLAVASAGGHWIQLLRLMPAFEGTELSFASTSKGNYIEVEGYPFYSFQDATRKEFWKFILTLFQVFRILWKVRPDIIITTGSAPGMVTLGVGKLFSTKNVWIDSIANVEELSTSGKIARKFADLYCTQWQDLTKKDGPVYIGAII